MLDLLSVLRLARDDIWDTPPPARRRGDVKVARHVADVDLDSLRRGGFFDEYQRRQGKDHFAGTRLLVSLLGERGTRSRFIGVYRVLSVTDRVPKYPRDYPHPTMGLGRFYYEMEKLDGFEELEDRLIVDWGAATRSWVQWLDPANPKEVIEILPRGHVRDFPGYDAVVLGFEELANLVSHPDANRTWHRALGAVAGVYLIADLVDGRQYVGSAYGEQGILGRWCDYARGKHGGNIQLKELLLAHPGRENHFRYSILQTLPRTMTKNEVIAVESSWKAKLGTRAFGLNSN